MRKREIAVRGAAIALGAALMASVAGAAVADEVENDDVAVTVTIPQLETPGVLAMSVAANSTVLTEGTATADYREFTGILPTVTVTDTRSAEDVPADAGWYVLGSSTDLTSATDTISAGHLGWAPALLDGGDSGLVTEGEQVDTILDEGDDAVGLVDQELLALAISSGDVLTEGSWTANANLFLRTPLTVAPGQYSSTLTLSLFE
jgi:hypothetical protein